MAHHEQQNDNQLILIPINNRWFRFDTSLQPLGEGAMGVVYLGFDYYTNESVAIKQVRPRVCEIPYLRNRAKLEATLCFDHPNLVHMLGYFEPSPDSGPLYIVSEYVTGITFLEHVTEQLSKLSKDKRDNKIVEEFLPILDAVSYLHSKGIIHRDIKPENIMFSDGYRPVLMDLGVAYSDRFFDSQMPGTIGSPNFIAPELVVPVNVVAKVNERCDIYSLGATLLYLLENTTSMDLSNLSPSLRSAIELSINDDPEARYENVGQFKDALMYYLLKSNNDKIENKSHNWIYFLCGIVALAFLIFMILI